MTAPGVHGVDHVNIVAADLGETCRFYHQLLGLTESAPSGIRPDFAGRWLRDADGHAVLHLTAHDPQRHGTPDAPAPTGAVHHIALACRGFAALRGRCEALGIEHRVNDRGFGTLRQIFVTDPNNVMVELNFAGD